MLAASLYALASLNPTTALRTFHPLFNLSWNGLKLYTFNPCFVSILVELSRAMYNVTQSLFPPLRIIMISQYFVELLLCYKQPICLKESSVLEALSNSKNR